MKLNKTKVRYILHQNRNQVATKEIARDIKVSQRIVQQIIKQYKGTGQEPILGGKTGRPSKPMIKQKRRKWVRRERKHSLSAWHIDWHECEATNIKVCVILDDASRMVLAGGEFSEINAKNSKLVIDQMVDKYWWLCPMSELILDNGSEF